MKLPRPRFSLLTLVLFSLTCGMAMLAYSKRHPWIKISESTPTRPQDQFKAGNRHIDYNQFWLHIWSDPPQVVDLYNKNEFSFSEKHPPHPSSVVLGDTYLLALVDVEWGGATTFGEIWDLKSRKKVQTIPMRTYMNGNFALSPNGRYLFEADVFSDMWDLETGEQLVGGRMDTVPHAQSSPEGLELTREQSQKAQRLRMQQAELLTDYLRAAYGPRWILPTTDNNFYGVEMGGFPYYIDMYAQVSSDGSRVVTVEHKTNVYHVWDGNTLKRLGTLTIPEFSVMRITPDGSRMLAVTDKTRTMYDLKEFRALYELPSIPDAPGVNYDWVVFPAHSDVMIEDVSGKKVKGKKRAVHQRLWNWRSGELLKTGPKGTLDHLHQRIDSTRSFFLSSISTDSEGGGYFDFKTVDRNVERIVTLSPDRRYAITQDTERQQQVWRNLRLEKHASIYYVAELYVALLMGLATLASLFYKRNRTA